MTRYALVAAAVIIACMAGVIWFQNGRIEALNQDVATERANVRTAQDALAVQRDTIEDLRLQRVRDEAALRRLNEDMIDAEDDRREAVSRLDQWRSTLRARTLEKPDVAGRAARIAIGRVLRDAERASQGGDDADADPAPDRPAADAAVRAGDAAAEGGDPGDDPSLE